VYCRGTACHTAKLSEGDVRLIRALREAGLTYRAIAAKFEISPVAVWRCANNRSWSHIPTIVK